MTDDDFYEALQRCFMVEPKYKRCGSCPLLHSERNCEYVMKDEIRHRLVLARQAKRDGFKQLSLIGG